MGIVVLKFGGSCLATPEKIKKRAEQIKEFYQRGNKVIVVVSAMGQQTNDLVKLAYQVSEAPHRRELDMLLSTGERISMALMSMVLNDIGCPAISFTGSQAGILTEEHHNNARIKEIKPIRVEEELNKNKVVIVAGFQGVNPITKEVTTLGRGGSDTTALALAKHFKGDCYVYKDVPGVCNADPNIYKNAKTIQNLSHDQLIELCQSGARVLHLRAAELAKEINLNYRIVDADNPGLFSQLTNTNNPLFKAISIVNEVSVIKKDFDFHNWLEDMSLNFPHTFNIKDQICFWGDLEVISPIHKMLQEQNINFVKSMSFINLICEGKETERILCSTDKCQEIARNYETFLNS
ncbi:MAG: aspartate kinase [Bdellovibrionales bacterium]|nr:aspartate kinase [Bdellovibrionales bacterium]